MSRMYTRRPGSRPTRRVDGARSVHGGSEALMIALTIIALTALLVVEFVYVQRSRRAPETSRPDLRSVPTGPLAGPTPLRGLQPIPVESARSARLRTARTDSGDLPPVA